MRAIPHHHPGLGIPATAQLQAELMVGRGYPPIERFDYPYYPWGPQLLWEPGFEFQATHQGSVNNPDRPFDSVQLSELVGSAPTIPADRRAGGPRVAVLDTGVRGAGADMVDFINCAKQAVSTRPADDPHGHGSAVAQVIKAVQGGAEIHPIRVLNEDNIGQSYEVLAGLMYALWSGQYHLINASLTTKKLGACATSLGRSIDHTVRYCSAMVNLPMLVAAAGNDGSGTLSGYPARVPEAVVALALDNTGGRAAYNSTPPPGAVTAEAYGGSDTSPLGSLTHSTGSSISLWGTSFAAAVISGAYLP
ncbi:S8/S53 family peptidase [Streptomyces canus]|uniref:S8/S53 family peptidase n=1 Tax=Streptomyces canus TaxID=58343 RepID=UPI002DDA4186|nr:S8/S53 family peptidase [Streptomyces canus]WSD82964.1 S8/S53 family peptidase [Streptomyces canus]WSD91869.1 S8/S53 family peptidase [Streptomyces canus]WSD92640.1 S8/S53 family peptidase [Streptomyces canus]